MGHRPWILNDKEKNMVKYTEFQAYEKPVRHGICINDGLIFDGALGQPIKLSRESMQWQCGDENFLMKIYVIEPSSKCKKVFDKKEKAKNV